MAEGGNVCPMTTTITPDAHNFYHAFEVENISSANTWIAQFPYHTNCSVFPTSWSLKMIFYQAQEDGSISWSVCFSRVDSNEDRPVKAYLWIAFFNALGQFMRLPKKLGENRILPGEQISDHVEKFLSEGGLENLPEQKFEVQVSLYIRDCHNINPVENLARDMNRMFLW